VVPPEGGVGSILGSPSFKSQGETIVPFVVASGFSGDFTSREIGNAVALEFAAPRTGADLQLWILRDGGHSWPRIAAGGAAGAADDPVNHDIDANERMLQFFRDHPRRGASSLEVGAPVATSP
jgi:hypothetical protein